MKGRIHALLLACSASCALAGQISTPIGSGFANACAGDQYFDTIPDPGAGFSTTNDQYINCQTTTGAPALASTSNSGTVNGHPYSNSASAQSGPGFIKIGASNTGSASVPFDGAAAYAGWNDQITLNNGTGSAVWVVGVNVQGDLSATGFDALTRLGISAYENYNFLQPSNNAINSFAYNNVFLPLNGGSNGIRNSVILFGFGYQAAWFGAVDYGPSDPGTLQNYTLNRTLFFALPFTYGTPFEFGIYAGGVAGENASGADNTLNTASYDLSHTITWAGNSYVIDQNNQINPNFTITSQSGFDYTQPFPESVPEPATLALTALALVFCAAGHRFLWPAGRAPGSPEKLWDR